MNVFSMTTSEEWTDEDNTIEELRAELRAARAGEAEARQALIDAQALFISRLTHDLKNPLTTVMGRIEMLKRVAKRSEITSADLDKHLVLLSDAVARLQELLQNASQKGEVK